MKINVGKYIVVCPNRPADRFEAFTVFLAGGITGCRNWQLDAMGMLPDGITILSPRRPDWPIGDPGASAGQIGWEVEHLRGCDMMLVWFSDETLQPITWYEMGKYIGGTKRMAVGASPAYPRRADVVLQVGYERPTAVVHDNLRATCDEVARQFKISRA